MGWLDKKIGGGDKGRMEQYLTAVRETEIRTERADAWLDVPRPDRAHPSQQLAQEQASQGRTDRRRLD